MLFRWGFEKVNSTEGSPCWYKSAASGWGNHASQKRAKKAPVWLLLLLFKQHLLQLPSGKFLELCVCLPACLNVCTCLPASPAECVYVYLPFSVLSVCLIYMSVKCYMCGEGGCVCVHVGGGQHVLPIFTLAMPGMWLSEGWSTVNLPFRLKKLSHPWVNGSHRPWGD